MLDVIQILASKADWIGLFPEQLGLTAPFGDSLIGGWLDGSLQSQ